MDKYTLFCATRQMQGGNTKARKKKAYPLDAIMRMHMKTQPIFLTAYSAGLASCFCAAGSAWSHIVHTKVGLSTEQKERSRYHI